MTRDLTKWPRLLVVGEPVTETQANEILVRTCQPAYLSSNDREFDEAVRNILGFQNEWLRHGPEVGPEERLRQLRAVWDHNKRREEELGVISMEYLDNSRIASSWVGGSHGWCDWDGTIGCSTYNVGKWPTVEELTSEWAEIAQAFPYLNLRAQVVSDEGNDTSPAAEWVVKDGWVTLLDEPAGELLLEPDDNVWVAGFAAVLTGTRHGQGVSLDRLRVAVEQVLASRAG